MKKLLLLTLSLVMILSLSACNNSSDDEDQLAKIQDAGVSFVSSVSDKNNSVRSSAGSSA